MVCLEAADLLARTALRVEIADKCAGSGTVVAAVKNAKSDSEWPGNKRRTKKCEQALAAGNNGTFSKRLVCL